MTKTLTAAQFRQISEKPKKQKFNAVPTTVDGVRFDSKKEASRYAELKRMEKAGLISHLELQPKFRLMSGDKPVVYDSGQQAVYVADFAYFSPELNKRVIEDVKSKATKTPVYKLKKALVHAQFPMTKIIEV